MASVSLSFFNSTSGKIITAGVILFLVFLWFMFRGVSQVNRPCALGAVLPGATANIDQRSLQVAVSDKPWEVSAGVIVGRVYDKDVYGGGFAIKFKF
jgi:lipoprotein signal peptidase